MKRKLEYDDSADELWELTETDWAVSLSSLLTDPACFVVSLWPDEKNSNWPRITDMVGTGDANETIRLACDKMVGEIKLQRWGE